MKDEKLSSTDAFFKTGARTCLDALAALALFRHDVQERCRKVALKHLETLSAASGLKISGDDLVDYEETEKPDSPEARFMGIRLPFEAFVTFHFYFGITRGDDGAPEYCTWAQLNRHNQTIAKKFWKRVEAKCPRNAEYSNRALYFGGELDLNEAVRFEHHLEKALKALCSCIQKNGGLRQYKKNHNR